MGKPHELHRHRLLEHKFSLPPEKCIVDAEFSYLFSAGTEQVEGDNDHIIVLRSEYKKIKLLLAKLDTSRGCSHEHFQQYLIGFLPHPSDAGTKDKETEE